MIMTYKILHGLVDLPVEEFFQYNTSCTRSNGLKLQKPHTKTNMNKYSFAARVINDWNSLPTNIVMATKTTSFKTLLDVYWYDCRFSIL